MATGMPRSVPAPATRMYQRTSRRPRASASAPEAIVPTNRPTEDASQSLRPTSFAVIPCTRRKNEAIQSCKP